MKTVLANAGLLVVTAILAVQPADAAGREKRRYKPDQIICESRALIGSRLKRIRVCHTAQEWEEVRTQEKVGLMRQQYNGASGMATIAADSPN
jgi:3-phenylpropionate/cinnamic acid dioxygenase small subunit